MTEQLILASASPRRQELLQQMGVTHSVCAVDIDETVRASESPLDYVQRVAAEKSAACQQVVGKVLPILAADTTVVIDARIMGKPVNEQDAATMLNQLSGRTHQVFSAVSLRGREHWQNVSVTEVTFRSLSAAEIHNYWQTGEPVDKAGSYAIQGLGAVFVESIKGSFSGVVGLPLFETMQLLSKQGIRII